MFRLAESHRMLGNAEAARSGYERLLKEFRKGEFAGAGAYRLGEYLYAEKKYDPALIQFQLAAAESDNNEVRISAKYNIARSLDRLKRWDEAAKFYEEVAAIQKNSLPSLRPPFARGKRGNRRTAEGGAGEFFEYRQRLRSVRRPSGGRCQSRLPRGRARRQKTGAQAFHRGV